MSCEFPTRHETPKNHVAGRASTRTRTPYCSREPKLTITSTERTRFGTEEFRSPKISSVLCSIPLRVHFAKPFSKLVDSRWRSRKIVSMSVELTSKPRGAFVQPFEHRLHPKNPSIHEWCLQDPAQNPYRRPNHPPSVPEGTMSESPSRLEALQNSFTNIPPMGFFPL